MPDIPEPWATAMVDRGFTDRRTKVPRPSARALADAAGVHATTVLAMIGGASSDPRSVEAVAEALGRDPETVSGWIDPARLVSGPWVPPDEARLLDRRQRDALAELIRAMTSTRKAGEGSEQRPASIETRDEVIDFDARRRKPIPTDAAARKGKLYKPADSQDSQ